jgi:uncharacterized membrane protein YkvA (DUF1232 family)
LLDRGIPDHFGLAGWTHDCELLTLLVDEIRSLHSTLVAVNSRRGKGFKFAPMPRPVTALDRVQRRRRLARHDDLVAKATRNRPPPPDSRTPTSPG